MMTKVFIDGSAGTTGLRIHDRLSSREDLTLITLPEELRKDSAARREAMNGADIVFLCLPDAAAIEAVGMIDLAAYDPLNSRAEVCIGLLGKYRGQGFASEALRLLCEYSFKRLHIHQLFAYIAVENDESRKLFAKNGFVEASVLKDWLRNEKGFSDVVLVQKMAE